MHSVSPPRWWLVSQLFTSFSPPIRCIQYCLAEFDQFLVLENNKSEATKAGDCLAEFDQFSTGKVLALLSEATKAAIVWLSLTSLVLEKFWLLAGCSTTC